jgi:hypothetical protein
MDSYLVTVSSHEQVGNVIATSKYSNFPWIPVAWIALQSEHDSFKEPVAMTLGKAVSDTTLRLGMHDDDGYARGYPLPETTHNVGLCQDARKVTDYVFNAAIACGRDFRGIFSLEKLSVGTEFDVIILWACPANGYSLDSDTKQCATLAAVNILNQHMQWATEVKSRGRGNGRRVSDDSLSSLDSPPATCDSSASVSTTTSASSRSSRRSAWKPAPWFKAFGIVELPKRR